MIRKNTRSSSGPSRKSTKRSPQPARKAAKPRRVQPAMDKPAPVLSPQRRRQLRADAHALEPVVQVGHGGVSEAVVRAVGQALRDHELIKVRLHEPEDKQTMAEMLAQETRSALCGLVGHTVILFRPKPKAPSSGVARSAIKRNQEKRGGRKR